MRRSSSSDFVYQLAALLLAVITVHAVYIAIVRPRADVVLAEQQSRMATDPDYIQERSIYVIVRDFEQEACFILLLWAIAIMAKKSLWTGAEQRYNERQWIEAGERVTPRDVRSLAERIEAMSPRHQRALLPRALLGALHRFDATAGIQNASETGHDICISESDRLESELSMVRYIAWAIPSIGFIGTVRGIGEALAQAHKAVEGDIAGVTQSLGVAFNSTFIALLISIVLMFLLHQLQLQQERLVLDTQSALDEQLIRRLRVKSPSASPSKVPSSKVPDTFGKPQDPDPSPQVPSPQVPDTFGNLEDSSESDNSI